MNLYSTATSIYCHRTRIVLAEKDIAHESIIVDPKNLPEDLIDLNPYSSLPTLVDRDLVLYNSRVIMEYLEERFPSATDAGRSRGQGTDTPGLVPRRE